MKIRLRYICDDFDRHGNVRVYFRRAGQPKIRLPLPIGSPEFLAAYRQAFNGDQAPKPRKAEQAAAGSLRWLCVQWFCTAAFRSLDPKTQRVRRAALEKLCEEHGHKPARLLEARHIRKMRDAISDRPEAANQLIKTLRQLLAFGVEYEHVQRNPARDVPYIKTHSEGFHSWSPEEVAQFEAQHPIGTKARLALALLLYTGQRRSDVIRLGRPHLKNGELTFTQFKGRNRKPVRLTLPVIPELERIIASTKCGELTFITTEFGKPYSDAGFGNWFRRRCDEAGLKHCSAHGLRKAAAARLGELGCSELEIMAVTGHTTSKEVGRYTKAANQQIRAQNALAALAADQDGNKSVPLSSVIEESETILPLKRLKKKG